MSQTLQPGMQVIVNHWGSNKTAVICDINRSSNGRTLDILIEFVTGRQRAFVKYEDIIHILQIKHTR